MKPPRFKKLSFVVAAFISTQALLAQDPHLSQFERAPLLINPSFTGTVDSTFRIGGLTSFQQSTLADLNHNTFFIERKVKGKKGNWGFGASYYSYGHKTSIIKAAFYALSIARNFALNKKKDHWFSIGAQITSANGKANPTNKLGAAVIEEGGFRYNVNSESVNGDKGYVDVNLGAMHRFTYKGIIMETGAAIYHLNRPAITINGDGPPLRRRITISNHVNAIIDNKKSLHFRTIFYREGLNWLRKIDAASFAPYIYSDFINSVTIECKLKSNIVLEYGLATRDFASIMPKAGLKFKNGLDIFGSYETITRDKSGKIKRAELSATYLFL